MNWDETVALFLQGREAWNAWAEKMLAERKALEEAGVWKARRERSLEPETWEPEEGENPETQAWLEKARASFFRCLFLARGAEGTEEPEEKGKKDPAEGGQPVKSIELERQTIDFSEFVFPSDAWFESAAFSGVVLFESATFSGVAWFERTTFSGDARFQSATFSGYASFASTTFSGVAWFERATFSGDARFGSATFSGFTSFESATFSGDASFESATFSGTASFGSATFSGDARFGSATFSGNTWFDSATFSGDTRFGSATFSGTASFESATFSGRAQFRSATFQNYTNYQKAKFREASFKGVKVERAFDMTGAEFAQVPAFNQADFKQAPDLDDVKFLPPPFWRGGNAKLVPQYRALRRMAIQSADYEREQMAYKGELRARRWTVDKWWSIGTWIGLFYDAFADCGRSIVRPTFFWLVSVAVFAAFYWQRAAAGVEARCEEAGGAVVQALFLSVKNALVIFGGTRDARVNQAYLCLYTGSAEQPHIPPTVTFVETLAQIPVSATLIFLFLLAVKNRFKIK